MASETGPARSGVGYLKQSIPRRAGKAIPVEDNTTNAKIVKHMYERWNRWLLQFLGTRLQERENAKDLSQEVYARLLKARSAEPIHNPKAYLARTALNVMDDWRRRSVNAKPHGDESLDSLKDPFDLDASVDVESLQRDVKAALDNIPQLWRSVIVLHYQDELTYAQIALELGISQRMVKRYLANAYAYLRLELVGFSGNNKGDQTAGGENV